MRKRHQCKGLKEANKRCAEEGERGYSIYQPTSIYYEVWRLRILCLSHPFAMRIDYCPFCGSLLECSKQKKIKS